MSVSPSPVVGGHVFTQLVAGLFHTCGLASDGTWCWGNNNTGMVGNGDSTNVYGIPTPARVGGGAAFRTLMTGGYTCALGSGLLSYCWGGWIQGNGHEEGSRVPVPTGAWFPDNP